MSDDKKKGKDLNFEGLNSSFAELMKEILEDEPDYLSASDIDKALGVSPESNDPIFIGTYSCEISRGKIALPIKHIAVWAIAETFEDDNCVSCGKTRILLSNDLSRLQDDYIKIISHGECEIDRRGLWKMPDCVIQLLGSEKLILEGLFAFAELMTPEDFEKSEAEMLERLNMSEDKI